MDEQVGKFITHLRCIYAHFSFLCIFYKYLIYLQGETLLKIGNQNCIIIYQRLCKRQNLNKIYILC